MHQSMPRRAVDASGIVRQSRGLSVVAARVVGRLPSSPVVVTGAVAIIIAVGIHVVGVEHAGPLLLLLTIPPMWFHAYHTSARQYWVLSASAISGSIVLVAFLSRRWPTAWSFWLSVASVVAVTTALSRLLTTQSEIGQPGAGASQRPPVRDGYLSLLRRLIMSQEGERQRIGRELHDQIGQLLTALKYHLETLESLSDASGGQGRRTLDAATQILERSFEELHRVVFDLRPKVLDDLGLAPALRYLAREFLENMDLPVRLDLDAIGRIAAEKETALFRIAQEALTNVIRHAHATQVAICLHQSTAGSIQLTIEDNGQGFAPERDGPTSLGLRSMCERAEMLGGTCEIASRVGGGSLIRATLPS